MLLGGKSMKKIGVVFASAYFLALVGGITGAQAHTVQQCQQELKTYASMCKFSPTAWVLGLCKNKKAQTWCSNKKKHDDKFHK